MRPDPTPPKPRSYPTRAQFDVLVTFYKYHKRISNRTKRPSLRDVALEHGISHRGVLGHVEALAYRGYLQQRRVWEWRGWELTPAGVKRAEKRWKLEKRRAQKQLAAARERKAFEKGWRKRMREASER